jgi:isoquinoline 1-oxidoreductase subunit beta
MKLKNLVASRAEQSTFLTRRHFLIGAGLSVSFLGACSVIPPIPKRPEPKTSDALGWISLTEQGQWRLYSPRMEMGQNIASGLRDIAALELGVAASDIEVSLPSTKDIARFKATVGSDSIRELTLPLAQACYTLRQAILERARLALQTSNSEPLSIVNDAVETGKGKRVALKALAKHTQNLEAQQVPKEVLRFFAKRTTQDPRASGRSATPFFQQQAILRGEALFTADVRLPKMLYALVLRSPWPDKGLAESRLMQWNRSAVSAVTGFHSVVEHPLLAGPALIANRIAALESMRLAADAQWERPKLAQSDPMQIIDIDTALTANQFTKSKGSTSASNNINMRVDIPLASHAAIEPRCAVAQMTEAKGLELWAGTQDRDVIQRDTGLPLEKITVNPMRIGGAFGGKTIATVEREASILAMTVGQAVKVQWSRADEFQAGFHRQPSSHRIQAHVASNGVISDWRHSLSTSHVLFTNAILPPWLQALTNLIGDDGAARGQTPIYGFGRQQIDLKLTRLPVLTGPWRGLGAGPNVTAIEMAMDLAARSAGIDPLTFRLNHLNQAPLEPTSDDPTRLAHCLREVTTLAQSTPLSPREQSRHLARHDPTFKVLKAQGLAGGVYKGSSYAAAIAEVAIGVNAEGQVKFIQMLKLWCTHDCGQIVNERSVEAQIQGNLVWSIGMVLKERLEARLGTPEQINFAQYTVPTIGDVPRMEVQLIASDAAPTGAGETAIVAGAGAIANAVVRAYLAAGLRAPSALPFQV